jgi:hypothetical protein
MRPRPTLPIVTGLLVPLALLACGTPESPPGTGVPVLSAIKPETAPAGSPELTLTIAGDAFYSFSVVRWAGTALQSTYVDNTEIHAQVPASLLASPGTFDVTVETIAPGGGTSPPKSFLVEAVVLGRENVR